MFLRKACFHTAYNQKPVLNLESTGFLGYTGMQHRTHLPKGDALLFEFKEAADHGFWMKNVRISLDIIFIDSSNKVVYIHANAQPMSSKPIFSGKKVVRVIETSAGWCQENGVGIGNQVSFSFN